MKYVIVQPHGIDFEFAIMFPEVIQHFQAFNPSQARAISAGFFRRDKDGSIFAWGRSDSLKLSSRGTEDAMLIHFSESMPSIQDIPATEQSRIAEDGVINHRLPAVGESDDAPKGLGTDGYKPLMQNRQGHEEPFCDRDTAGNTF